MVLFKRKAKAVAFDLYDEIIMYSRKNSVLWKNTAPSDIKDADRKVLKELQNNISIATIECKNNLPLILVCVECGLEQSIEWFLYHAKDRNVIDSQGQNIASYAYEYNLTHTLNICKSIAPELLSSKDANGISVLKRMENDEKMQALKDGQKPNDKKDKPSKAKENEEVDEDEDEIGILDEFFLPSKKD